MRAGAVDGVALGDAAEVEAEARLELDPARRRSGPRRRSARGAAGGAVRADLVEGAVVAGGDERVVDGRVEQAAGPLARLDGEPGDLDEVGAGVERAGAVERRELGVRAEAREQRLQPLELALGPVEGHARSRRSARRPAGARPRVPIAGNVRRSITTSS